ncbi:hypothetical protein SNEBB_008139 [Seison nebaliae]|nr:hypothetical protein SNEBB_008139 [Seison nebaliae]
MSLSSKIVSLVVKHNRFLSLSSSVYSRRPVIDSAFDQKWENYFNKETIDSWELRQGINEMQGTDVIPEPKIVSAVLKACRRNNDHSLAVRYLEALKYKCADDVKTVYPWLIQEITPTLKQLGISTPDELGYDKPELAIRYYEKEL